MRRAALRTLAFLHECQEPGREVTATYAYAAVVAISEIIGSSATRNRALFRKRLAEACGRHDCTRTRRSRRLWWNPCVLSQRLGERGSCGYAGRGQPDAPLYGKGADAEEQTDHRLADEFRLAVH